MSGIRGLLQEAKALHAKSGSPRYTTAIQQLDYEVFACQKMPVLIQVIEALKKQRDDLLRGWHVDSHGKAGANFLEDMKGYDKELDEIVGKK